MAYYREFDRIGMAMGLPIGGKGYSNDPNAPIIISIDIKSFLHAPRCVTEVGLAVLDPTTLAGDFTDANILKSIQTFHFRVREEHSREVKNTRFGKAFNFGDDFDYGISEFVKREDVGKALFDIIARDADGEFRPVIMISHGGVGDGSKLTNEFGFDMNAHINELVGLQEMLRGSRIPFYKQGAPSLKEVANANGLQPPNLHNAGNDAFVQLYCAILMVRHTFIATIGGEGPESLEAKSIQEACAQQLERSTPDKTLADYRNEWAVRQIQPSTPEWGVLKHCWRCDGVDHGADSCPVKSSLACSVCLSVKDHSTACCTMRDQQGDAHLETVRGRNRQRYNGFVNRARGGRGAWRGGRGNQQRGGPANLGRVRIKGQARGQGSGWGKGRAEDAW